MKRILNYKNFKKHFIPLISMLILMCFSTTYLFARNLVSQKGWAEIDNSILSIEEIILQSDKNIKQLFDNNNLLNTESVNNQLMQNIEILKNDICELVADKLLSHIPDIKDNPQVKNAIVESMIEKEDIISVLYMLNADSTYAQEKILECLSTINQINDKITTTNTNNEEIKDTIKEIISEPIKELINDAKIYIKSEKILNEAINDIILSENLNKENTTDIPKEVKDIISKTIANSLEASIDIDDEKSNVSIENNSDLIAIVKEEIKELEFLASQAPSNDQDIENILTKSFSNIEKGVRDSLIESSSVSQESDQQIPPPPPPPTNIRSSKIPTSKLGQPVSVDQTQQPTEQYQSPAQDEIATSDELASTSPPPPPPPPNTTPSIKQQINTVKENLDVSDNQIDDNKSKTLFEQIREGTQLKSKEEQQQLAPKEESKTLLEQIREGTQLKSKEEQQQLAPKKEEPKTLLEQMAQALHDKFKNVEKDDDDDEDNDKYDSEWDDIPATSSSVSEAKQQDQQSESSNEDDVDQTNSIDISTSDALDQDMSFDAEIGESNMSGDIQDEKGTEYLKNLLQSIYLEALAINSKTSEDQQNSSIIAKIDALKRINNIEDLLKYADDVQATNLNNMEKYFPYLLASDLAKKGILSDEDKITCIAAYLSVAYFIDSDFNIDELIDVQNTANTIIALGKQLYKDKYIPVENIFDNIIYKNIADKTLNEGSIYQLSFDAAEIAAEYEN